MVGAALNDLAPANLSFGNGRADFAINRRENTPNGVKIGENPKDLPIPTCPCSK